MRFVQSKCTKIAKNAFPLWRQQRENAKTVFRHSAFYTRPAKYLDGPWDQLTGYQLACKDQ